MHGDMVVKHINEKELKRTETQPQACIHTHTQIHAHTQTHTDTHTQRHAHKHSHTRTNTVSSCTLFMH